MPGRTVLTIILCGGVLTAIPLYILWLAARRFPGRLCRPNFLGRLTPVIGGLALLVALAISSPFLAARWTPEFKAFWIAVVGFGLVGWIDDLFGDRTARGFRGHAAALIHQGKMTTGMLKVVGGGLISIACSAVLAVHQLPIQTAADIAPVSQSAGLIAVKIVLCSLFIALSANTFNLIDLRPGRCVFVAIAAAVVLLIIPILAFGSTDFLLIGALGGLLVIAIPDRAGAIMLGDAGSNTIGAGLAVCAIASWPLWTIALLLLPLAAFQIWCEKHSLSALIDSTPLLSAIDRKIGVR